MFEQERFSEEIERLEEILGRKIRLTEKLSLWISFVEEMVYGEERK